MTDNSDYTQFSPPLESSNGILEAQRDLCQALASVTDTGAAASICLDAALAVSGLDAGSVYLLHEDDQMHLAAFKGVSGRFVDAEMPVLPGTPAHKSLWTGLPIYTSTDHPPWNAYPRVTEEGLQGLGIIPVMHDRKLIAVFNVASRAHASIPGQTRTVLELIAATVGGAVARIQAQEALAQSEAHLREIMEGAKNFAIFRLAYGKGPLDFTVIFVSPSLKTLFGVADPMRFESWLEVLHPEDRERLAQAAAHTYTTGYFNETSRFYHPEKKEWRWLRIISTNKVHEAGTPLFGNGIVLDITERKRAEEALLLSKQELQQNEEKYRLLVENASEAIGIIQDEALQFPNPAAIALFGLQKEQTRRISLKGRIHPQDEKEAMQFYTLILTGDKTTGSISLRFLDASGATRWVHANVARTMWEGRPAVLAIMRDVTHEMQLEAQLRQAQKMEAIGTLAGGIAHNFNNILGVIMGFTELTMQDAAPESIQRANLTHVLDAAHRARDLVSQILTFSRQDPMSKKPLDLAPLVEDAARLLGATVPSSVKVVSQLAVEPCSIMGNASQIKQILLNMGSNAANAMSGPEGGVLTLGLDAVDAASWDLEAESSGLVIPAVRLVVSDTGRGMDEKTLGRIFDPYFTTMEPGQGTGLGLSVVHGVVKGHKGSITVKSQPGKGTTFTILFPRIETQQEERVCKPGIVMGDREHVLFVDDEPAIAVMAESMLTRMNYRVTVSQSPLEALELFKAQNADIDILVTDQTMPQMTGEMLIKKVREIRPDMPVIACTGHTEYFDINKARELGIQAFCPKPLSFSEFSKTLHRVLAERKEKIR